MHKGLKLALNISYLFDARFFKILKEDPLEHTVFCYGNSIFGIFLFAVVEKNKCKPAIINHLFLSSFLSDVKYRKW